MGDRPSDDNVSVAIRVAGFDPGNTTGYAVISIKDGKISPVELGEQRNLTETNPKALTAMQHVIEGVDYVVIEDFKLRPDVAQKGRLNFDSMPASVVIGRIKTLADLAGKPWVLQQPSLKPVAYGLSGMKYQKGKAGMHAQDALAHAVYYAVRRLKALPVGASV